MSILTDSCSEPIFNAIEDGLIQVNPANKMGRFLPRDEEKFEAVFLTPEEAESFVEAVLELSPEHYTLFLTFLVRECVGEKW